MGTMPWISVTCVSYFFSVVLIIPATTTLCRRPYIDILITPVVENGSTNEIILIWNIESVLSDGWIILKNGTKDVFKAPVNTTEGSVETNIYFESNKSYPFTKLDLGYHVEYRQEVTGAIIAKSSMETNPTWMGDHADVLGEMRLSDMFIPGTHDSAAYTPDVSVKEKRVQKYVMAQDETILSQLIFGIRCFDLRVSYHSLQNGKTDQLYINHAVVKIQRLDAVIQQVKEFLSRTTREIVILDFHGFPWGLKPPHQTLVDFLINELSPYIAPPNLTWDAKLSDFWAINKTLILAYNKKEIQAKHSDVLWSPVTQMWGNKQDIGNLHDYLTNIFKDPPGAPWSAQAELTATSGTFISDKLKGLRNMAASINVQVTQWFQSQWGATCNIVTCDFFRSSGLVKTAISWNLRRARNSTCDLPMKLFRQQQ